MSIGQAAEKHMLDTLENDGFEAIRKEEMIALLDRDLRSGVARSQITRPVNTRSSLALAVHETRGFMGSPSLNMLTGTTAAEKKMS